MLLVQHFLKYTELLKLLLCTGKSLGTAVECLNYVRMASHGTHLSDSQLWTGIILDERTTKSCDDTVKEFILPPLVNIILIQ